MIRSGSNMLSELIIQESPDSTHSHSVRTDFNTIFKISFFHKQPIYEHILKERQIKMVIRL